MIITIILINFNIILLIYNIYLLNKRINHNAEMICDLILELKLHKLEHKYIHDNKTTKKKEPKN